MAQDDRKVVSPMHLPPLPPGNIPGTHFFYRRNVSMKNSSEKFGNRTRDLPACSAVPQTTVALQFYYRSNLIYW